MKKKILLVAVIIIAVITTALCVLTSCGEGSGGGGGTKVVAPKLTSLTAVRKNTTNADTDNVMCLSVTKDVCESVALTFVFDNSDGLEIYSITINSDEKFYSSNFRVGSTALKVVMDYTPSAKEGDYTVEVTDIQYTSGSTQKSISDLSAGKISFKIAPKFDITLDISESNAEVTTLKTEVAFMDTMANVSSFYDETQMDDIGGDYDYGIEGYGFAGWYTEEGGAGTLFTEVTVYDYYAGMTLYAHYEMYYTYSVIGEGEDAYAEITGITTTGKKRSALAIVDTLDGYTVKSIGTRAFINATNAYNIVLNESLETIGEGAFQSLSATITFNEKVSSIGDSAFSRCTGFKNFQIPASVKYIGANAFEYCTWNYNNSSFKTTLYIPNTVERIGDKAFYMSGFTKIYFESGCNFGTYKDGTSTLQEFGANVFDGNTALTAVYTSATINPSSKTIEVVEDNGLNYIGNAAFRKCTALKTLNLAEGLFTIDANAFSADTKGITTVTFPDSLQSIGENAFGNSGLTEIHFVGEGEEEGANSSLYTIGNYAFQSCGFTATTEVDIRARGLKNYGIAPFFGNTELKVIKILTEEVPAYLGKEYTYRDGGTYTKYYVPKDQLASFQNEWKIDIKSSYISLLDYSATLPICTREGIITDNSNRQYALTINEDNTATLETVFAPNTGEESSITVPATLNVGAQTYTITGIGAYMAHANLKSLSFAAPAQIKLIEAYAFAKVTGLSCDLSKLTNLETIGERAFYFTSVTSFVSGSNNLTVIGEDAFYMCSSLSTVKITKGTDVQICEGAFSTTGVTEVILGDEVQYVEQAAFAYCNGLKNVYIDESDIYHHKNNMYIGVFRSSAAGTTEGADAESANSELKIYFKNDTIKAYYEQSYYYTLRSTIGELVHPTVPSVGILHKRWTNFYSAYKNCFMVDAELVAEKCA